MDSHRDIVTEFYSFLEENDFVCHKNILDPEGIGSTYRNVRKYTLQNKNDVYVFDERDIVVHMCKEEDDRYREKTGKRVKLDSKKVDAVFIWNGMFVTIIKEFDNAQTWHRLLDVNPNTPCIICMDEVSVECVRTICGNCYCMICISCKNRMNSPKCPACMSMLSG